MPPPEASTALARFGISGEKIRTEPLTQGLINDAFKVFVEGHPRYVLQRINTEVFKAPGLLMENILQLLPLLEAQDYTGLRLRPTIQGDPYLVDEVLGTWRLFEYIPNSLTVEHTRNPDMAREAGRILGRFHQLVLPANVSDLHIHMPGFHDLNIRLMQLEEALETGIPERIETAGLLTELARGLQQVCREIPLAHLPKRICHNDTKLSNFLFDQTTGRALCLIDLDTLMPGVLPYDIGDVSYDLIRPDESLRSQEDTMGIDLGMFEALLLGLKDSDLRIAKKELDWLPHGPVLMPFLHGIRALTDYLTGDRYYRVSFPEQNLQRASGLLYFAKSTIENLPELGRLCGKILG